MHLLSVNVSEPQEIEHDGLKVRTGIFKQPVEGRVMLRQLHLEGDGQADLMAHGGVYKAAYIYPHEHYAHWQAELGRDDFAYGQFGENFTTTGLLETEVYIGNTYRIGAALVQVTQPRVPCYKLGIRMNDSSMVKRFMQAQKTGFYVRVLEEGAVGAGDPITLVNADPAAMSVYAVNRLLYFDKRNQEGIRRAAALDALAPGWRSAFVEMLAT